MSEELPEGVKVLIDEAVQVTNDLKDYLNDYKKKHGDIFAISMFMALAELFLEAYKMLQNEGKIGDKEVSDNVMQSIIAEYVEEKIRQQELYGE
jgi:hypothetical protein